MYKLLKCKEEPKKKQKYFLLESCVVFIHHNATFLKVCNLSDRCIVSKRFFFFFFFCIFLKTKTICRLLFQSPRPIGPKAQGPSFDLYIYIYIYIWVGPSRGANGEETHPSLVGLQFSSLIHEGFLLYKLFKKPSHNRCGT